MWVADLYRNPPDSPGAKYESVALTQDANHVPLGNLHGAEVGAAPEDEGAFMA